MAKKAKLKHNECGIRLPDLRTIHVTQKHIDKGVADDGAACPIALSIRAVLKAAGIVYKNVMVLGNDAEFDCAMPVSTPVIVNGKTVETISQKASVHVNLNLGKKAEQFVQRFDDAKDYVKPTSFMSHPVVSVELD